MTYVVKGDELAGVDLCGWRDQDGSLLIGPLASVGRSFRKRKNWPKEVKIRGRVFTLEEVVVGRAIDSPSEEARIWSLPPGKFTFENAVYV